MRFSSKMVFVARQIVHTVLPARLCGSLRLTFSRGQRHARIEHRSREGVSTSPRLPRLVFREDDHVASDADAFEFPGNAGDPVQERARAIAHDHKEISIAAGVCFATGKRPEEPDLDDIRAPLQQAPRALLQPSHHGRLVESEDADVTPAIALFDRPQ